jgi:uncharacterized DUF497 family protein
MGCEGFEWDEAKNLENQTKHGVSFEDAIRAFEDPKRLIMRDRLHSLHEERFYCMGLVEGRILTVRFTYRMKATRILGAGCWRRGRKHYEEENKIYG